MITASPRLRALFAGGAALVAFGLTAPAMADGANGQCPEGVYCGPTTQPDRDDPDAAPSQNGNGNGNATGRPPAGSVGNADNMNPKGQMPNGEEDGNSGYECDTNSGIGKSNPAHTGCSTGSVPPYSGGTS